MCRADGLLLSLKKSDNNFRLPTHVTSDPGRLHTPAMTANIERPIGVKDSRRFDIAKLMTDDREAVLFTLEGYLSD